MESPLNTANDFATGPNSALHLLAAEAMLVSEEHRTQVLVEIRSSLALTRVEGNNFADEERAELEALEMLAVSMAVMAVFSTPEEMLEIPGLLELFDVEIEEQIEY